MASTPILSPAPTTTSLVHHHHHQSLHLSSKLPFPTRPTTCNNNRQLTRLHVPTPTNKPNTTTATTSKKPTTETIFFDGGAHYGDLLANLILGFSSGCG